MNKTSPEREEVVEVKRLHEAMEKAKHEYYQFTNKIKKRIQSNCVHDWYYLGPLHGDDWYECTKCGKTKSE